MYSKETQKLILPKKTQYTRYHRFFTRVLHTDTPISKRVTLFVFALVVLSLSIQPIMANASILSALFTGVKASTTASTEVNSQTMQLPNPEYTAPEEKSTDKKTTAYTSIFLEEGVLASEVGPLGTDATFEEALKADTVSVYVVHKGDSLSRIAKLFDVSENTIRWANNLKKGQSPKEGDRLVILPVSGISYVVKKGDTLKSIASKFKADAEEVGSFNGYELDSELAYGETIIIPNGEVEEKVETPKKKTTTKTKLVAGATKLIKGFGGSDTGGYYIRPLAGGIRTQGLHGKNAVDIGASLGTPVYAAASGTAIIARTGGYNGGYGDYIILSHPNGTQTIYAHLSSVLISEGASVAQGQQIGTVGSTGRSTGPHLHWEVRGATNPLGNNPRYGL